MTLRRASRTYRTWIVDSTRWNHYRPRPGDIVIATYPKCGTTWMQQIVSLLIFQTTQPRSLSELSPWIDRRFPEPVDAMMAALEAQTHRRFLKAHLPADGLPLYDEVRYIHVGRDGRDACLSFHNHGTGFSSDMLQALDRSGLGDPSINRPYPRVPDDPAEYFHRWLTRSAVPGDEDGSPMMSYFGCERTWWNVRDRPNVLCVHFTDLLADLGAQMRRIARFLDIDVPQPLWPDLVAQADFAAMRQNREVLLGPIAGIFADGAQRFFHRGANGRWRGLFREDDLALYDAKLAALPRELARWLGQGGLGEQPALSES